MKHDFAKLFRTYTTIGTQRTRPARHVQQPDALATEVGPHDGGDAGHLHEVVLPQPVHARAHQVVHQVVLGGHAGVNDTSHTCDSRQGGESVSASGA